MCVCVCEAQFLCATVFSGTENLLQPALLSQTQRFRHRLLYYVKQTVTQYTVQLLFTLVIQCQL